jgi:hypothetical protein
LRLGGAWAPPSLKVLPQKKKKFKKNLKKIKILPQNLLFFQILAPPNFFFSIWPPQLGGLAPPLAVGYIGLTFGGDSGGAWGNDFNF